MITHHYQLTTVSTACLLILFLLIPSSIAPAQQLTHVDVQAAVKDLKNKDAGVRADAARRLVLLVVKAKPPNLLEARSRSQTILSSYAVSGGHISNSAATMRRNAISARVWWEILIRVSVGSIWETCASNLGRRMERKQHGLKHSPSPPTRTPAGD